MVATALDVRDEVDEDHRRSVHQVLRWFFCEIDTEEMLFRVDDLVLGDYEQDFDEDSEEDEYEEAQAPKRRIRLGS